MMTQTRNEREEIKEVLLKIVFHALIAEECNVERSIIVSSYWELDQMLCRTGICKCCMHEEAV